MKLIGSMIQSSRKPIWLFLTLMLNGLPFVWGLQPINAQLSGANEPVPPGRPGGSRGECDRPDTFANLPKLTFLSPDSPLVGTTVRDFPTFLVYTPFDLTGDSPGKLIVEDMSGREVYSYVIRNQSGNSIVTIPMSSSSKSALEVGKTYRMNFRVYCNDPKMSNSTSLRSRPQRIQRVASNTPGEPWYDIAANAYSSGVATQLQQLLESQKSLSNIPKALAGNK